MGKVTAPAGRRRGERWKPITSHFRSAAPLARVFLKRTYRARRLYWSTIENILLTAFPRLCGARRISCTELGLYQINFFVQFSKPVFSHELFKYELGDANNRPPRHASQLGCHLSCFKCLSALAMMVEISFPLGHDDPPP